MEWRRLGRTGQLTTVIVFGSAGISRGYPDLADRAIQTALEYGVNYLDVAPTYGEAKLRVKPWTPRIQR